MALSVPATRAPLSSSRRLALFTAAAAAGFVGGSAWSVEASAWVYNGLIQLFTDPAIQIASLGMAIGVGFLLGLVHITAI